MIVGSENPVLMSAAEQIFGAGWKRMRQALIFLISRATSEIAGSKKLPKEHRRLAEIIEMIHTASLIHDDILAESDMLRDVRKEVSPVVLIVVSCLVPILQHPEGLNNSLIENSAITLGRLAWVCLTTHRAFHAAVVYSLVHGAVHQIYGTRVAVLAGDFVIKVFSNGEIKQAFRLFDCDVHMDEYLIRVTTKQLPQSPLAPKEPPSSAASAVTSANRCISIARI
ncbi:hypothetical protein CASFOL_030216 [Castilleja foliolosa]|uniref:Uncharacterized protein n=1 Tax=Castilleja foliolosa TaxID=1961234 RepID=A0ABD3C7X1_9LAMI